jgi:RHS repeat-associated protein
VTDERSVQASYGYDPYGGEDATLTKELKQGSTTVITDPDDPLNAYRYTGKREDTGSGTLDMGARRFAPDIGRFISSDFYTDALADIGLSTDPLAQNRYALAGGNPVGYIEVDGHKIEAGGGGTSTGCLVQNGCYRSDDPDAFDTTPKPSGIEHFARGVAGAIKSGVKDTLPLVNVTDPEQIKAAWKGVGIGVATLGKCAAHSQADCRKIVDAAIKPCLHGAYGERAGCLTGTVLFAAVGTKGTGVVGKTGHVGKIAAEEVPLIKAGAAGGETSGKAFPQSVRQAALEENPSTCVYCRMETDSPQVDHAIARARGGDATLENAQTACPHCNASKGARDFPVTPPPGYRGPWPPPWWRP